VPQLPLNDRERDPFVGHLDNVRMPELVGRYSAADAGLGGELSELSAGCGCCPRASASWAVEDAEQRSDGFVRRRAAGAVAGRRGGRALAAGGIDQACFGHGPSWLSRLDRESRGEAMSLETLKHGHPWAR
jgi:hypothetical protein